MAINISKQLAEAGGSGMARHKNTMLPGIIGTFSDAKPHLRKAGEEALDMWHSKIGFLPLLDNEILSTAMKETNPNLRATLLTWLSKVLPNEKKLPGDFKDCIAPLFSCIEDRNGAVRDAAKASVQHFMAHLGYEAMSKATAKLDPTSKKSIQDILEKAREVCVPIAAPGKKGGAKGGASKSAGAAQAAKSAAMAAQAAAAAAEVSKEPAAPKKAAGKKEESSKPAKAEGRKTSKAVGSSSRSKKNAVVEDDGPPIIHKVGKNQRMKEEKALKVLKWNFSAPRDEIVEQLKEQIQPCVSPSMHTKLFHKDFKFHLEAIDILTKSIETYTDAMLESLDLLLKWVTLRFFDTNTSVLLKALDFISHLFSMLGDRDYQLSPFEAQAFMPYLVGKIGDPKDNVRKSVRGIVKQSTKTVSCQ
uniref:TOG domain-containing protein n=1 Tax=Clytia hemisphaerica TaxID=252671 RepID=A0A7M5X5E7_9CNID